MKIFYFDDPDFEYDVIHAVGDFIGEIFVDIVTIINNYSSRKPLDNEMFRVVESIIWHYMSKKESQGVKQWGCQFYNENNMVKVTLLTLFAHSYVTVNVTNMKVEVN